MEGCDQQFASYAHGTKGSAVISKPGHAPSHCRIFPAQDMKAAPIWECPTPEPHPYVTEWDDLLEAIKKDKPYSEVKRGAEARIRAGHPWIYRTQIADLKGFSEAGGTVEVVDAGGRFLGQGFYNPRPSLCCRLLSRRDEAIDAEPAIVPWSLPDLRLKLRFHRADLYLVAAIVISTFAMIWVLSATPAPDARQKPHLRLWERALISMGLAEAPEAPTANRGNPNISVWVDPKTALYYCVGEELYGKAPGGHVTTQREAQLDQFEPAGRAACE